jgi:hypothetical protein
MEGIFHEWSACFDALRDSTMTYPSTTSARRPDEAPGEQATHSPYVSASETQALLRSSLAARNARLEADDMVNTDQAAELAGTTRVTINAWIAKGRAIGLPRTRRGFRLPAWQFEPTLWGVIPKLSKALGTIDGWTMLAFLETPHGGLGGVSPRQALEQGQVDRVLALASAEGL